MRIQMKPDPVPIGKSLTPVPAPAPASAEAEGVLPLPAGRGEERGVSPEVEVGEVDERMCPLLFGSVVVSASVPPSVPPVPTAAAWGGGGGGESAVSGAIGGEGDVIVVAVGIAVAVGEKVFLKDLCVFILTGGCSMVMPMPLSHSTTR
jgi:hypothetical protein